MSLVSTISFDAFFYSENGQQLVDFNRFFLLYTDLSFLKMEKALNDNFGDESFLIFWEDENGSFPLNSFNFQNFQDVVNHSQRDQINLLVRPSGLAAKDWNLYTDEEAKGNSMEDHEKNSYSESNPRRQEWILEGKSKTEDEGVQMNRAQVVTMARTLNLRFAQMYQENLDMLKNLYVEVQKINRALEDMDSEY